MSEGTLDQPDTIPERASSMNGATSELESVRTAGVTRLRLSAGPLLRPVLCRVVSMVLTRADWPLDRLDEALIVCDALCAPTASESCGADADIRGRERLTFSVEADEHEAALRVWELTPESADRLLREAHLPLVGNVLERVAEQIAVESDPTSPHTRLTLALSAR